MLRERYPFYELRLYSVAPGRMQSMSDRFSNYLNRIFPRNNIHPIGGWCANSGPGLPCFIYIVPWESFEQRDNALASFFADPEWAEARSITNGPTQLVERYDIFLMKALEGVDPVTTLPPDDAGVYELVIQSVANDGRSQEIINGIIDNELPAYRRAGAEILGCFQMFVGPDLPRIVTLMKWDSANARQAGFQLMEADDELEQVKARQITEHGRRDLGSSDTYLMNLVSVEWEANSADGNSGN